VKDAFSKFKIYQNAFAAGSKLTSLPRPPSCIWLSLLDKEGKGIRKEREGKKKEATEGNEMELAPKRVDWVCPLKCG